MSILNNLEKQKISIQKFNAYTYFGAAKQVLLFPYDYFFRKGKVSYPLNINLFLTLNCNARCKMCNLKQLLNKKGTEMSIESIERLLKEVAKYKTNIVLFGGEPILRQDFLDILRLVKKYKLPCGIFTNGTLFNPELIKKIINLEMNFVAFSLQGIGKAHDEVVGIPGAYEKMIKAVKEFIKYKNRKTKIILHTTIWEDNLDELGKIVELGEQLGVDLIRFGHPTFFTKQDIETNKKVMKTVFPNEKVDEISCSYEPEERNEIYYNKLKAFIKKYKGRFHMTPDLNLEEIKNWYSNNFKCSRSCYFVYRGCFIYPNGDVVPCESFGFVMGNINQERFMDIWNSYKYAKFRQVLKKHLLPGCARCCKL